MLIANRPVVHFFAEVATQATRLVGDNLPPGEVRNIGFNCVPNSEEDIKAALYEALGSQGWIIIDCHPYDEGLDF